MSSIEDRIRRDEDYRGRVATWLSANGLEPNDIPLGTRATVADDRITTQVWVRDEAGDVVLDPAETGTLVLRTVTVPLLVPPTGDVAEWVKPRCPTCGR